MNALPPKERKASSSAVPNRVMRVDEERQGRTLKDTRAYDAFADLVEPVPDDGLHNRQQRRLPVDPDDGDPEQYRNVVATKQHVRLVQRLTRQEEQLLAAVDNHDANKVAGGREQVFAPTARMVASKPGTSRPTSAGVRASTTGARPGSAGIRHTGGAPVPFVCPKALLGVVSRPSSAAPQQPQGSATPTMPKQLAPPQHPLVVAPRPPSGAPRPQTTSRPATALATVVDPTATTPQRRPSPPPPLLVESKHVTPSERIAHNELGTIVRTRYQQAHKPTVLVHHTFRSGPDPVRACPEPAHNKLKGVDPTASHFLDANAYYCPADAHIMRPGATTHARYVISKKSDDGVLVTGEFRDVMRACRVVAYHPEYNTYTIEWLHNGVRKVIKPLAVMLPEETTDEFMHRIVQSEEQRDHDEAMLRFEAYAEQRFAKDVSPFTSTQLTRITALVAPSFNERHASLIRECEEVEQSWNVSMRESIAKYHLLSRNERSKVEALQLPHWWRPSPHEVLMTPATVEVAPDYTREMYVAARSTLERELFLAHEPLYRTTSFAVQRWRAFEPHLLVVTDVSNLRPPFEVSEFKKYQAQHNALVVKALEKEWITSIVHTMQAELDGTFDFFLANVQAYQTSRMSRYLRSINLMLSSQLQGLVYASLSAAQAFFHSLRVDPDTMQAVRDEMSGGATRKSNAFLKRVGCKGTASVVEPPFDAAATSRLSIVPEEPFGVPRDMDTADTIQGTVPVLICRIVAETKYRKIICTPSLEETEDAVREMFSIMLENTDALAGVGPQLFPMLNLRSSNLTEHARSVRRTDERVKACEAELMGMLDENISGPKALLNLYLPFSYLLAQTTEGFLATFKRSGHRTVDDFDAVCERLSQHIDLIEHRSRNEVVFPLLLVDCHQIKNALASKAKDVLHAMLKELVSNANDHIDAVDAKYGTVFERIQREPQTPEELQELRAFVDAVPSVMHELQNSFDVITQEVQLLGKYGYMPEQRAFEKYWASYSWPRKISVVMDDVPFQLQMFRAQFLALTHETTTKLQEAILDLNRSVNLLSYEENEAMVDDVVRRVAAIDATLQQLKVESVLANEHEAIFQQPITKWPLLKDIEKQFLPLAALWRVTAESREVEKWSDLSMERLDPQEISSLHASWLKEATRLGKILLHEISYTVAKYVKEKLEAFKTVLPVINALAKPSLLNRRRHVGRIAEMLNVNPKSFELREKTPSELVRLGIVGHMAAILEISDNADHEFKLESQLAAMREEWQKMNFTLQPYLDTALLKDTDDIRNLADEHVSKTQTMLASPYASAILQELKPWEEKVALISRTLDAWLQCQFGFRYLSPMFTQSEDIAVAMPDEAKAFEQVYALWRTVMDSVGKVPNVLIRCSEVKLTEQFVDANVRLDKIMKALCRYLDQKREVFPRFYFLSNEDLIEILSRSREPLRIQPYIQKCFEGIHHLTIEDSEDNEITEMVSSEGETVGLFEPIFPPQYDNVVDRWLVKLEQIMIRTIQSIVDKALQTMPSMAKEEWVRLWPGQVCIAASQIAFTMEAEASIPNNTLPAFVRGVHHNVRQLAIMVQSPSVTAVEMCTLQSLIVIMVHAKDVAESLVTQQVATTDDFAWYSQLRYYWEGNKKGISVKQTIATLPYGNEYLGNSSRLVITPLTDRCYRTLTAAYHLNYGGAPEGPAGTGKTETTKDLAKAIAKMCVVFNCSDQIKSFEMEKLLRGLAATGSWGCFDEFNRIDVQVLSVIAQQVLTIQLAVAQKRPQFLFEDRLCSLRDGCSVFITMNPGYAGRTELPDNLKSLFRPVAMMVPDYVFIAENSLYSCGFLEATALAKKIVAAYKLSSEQLSSQSHYDFGMRAVKSVLSAAQNLRQAFPKEQEVNLIMRAILDVNKPKFLANDALLFDGIMSDLFGAATSMDCSDENLDKGIRLSALRDNLQLPPFFSTKIRQLYELIKVRHGVMVVGYSVSGKTEALHTLAQGLTWAFEECCTGEPCTIHTLNPKAVSLAQLYGHNDASGTEWYDGILSNLFRTCAASTDLSMRHWIALDGPVDAMWIENMNTVLDDNKKLCLTNGDMIRMTRSMTMVFVVQDLFAASPATVSRCGMVYFEPQELGWKPLYESWLSTLPGALESSAMFASTSHALVHALLPSCIKFVSTSCLLTMPHTPQMMTLQFFRMYSLLLDHVLGDAERVAGAEDTDMQQYTEGVFYMALTWSIGGLLNASDREKLDGWLRQHVDMDGRKTDSYRTVLPLPEHGTLFQYKLEVPREFAGRPQWIDWLHTAHDPPMEQLAEEPLQDMVVNTSETISLTYLSKLLMKQREPILFVGPTATGKTMMVKALLKQQNTADVMSCHIQFSAQTSARELQQQLERRLERRGQRRYGPPLGKSLIAFVDDLGMPEPDAYGTQPPIELLRQLLVQGGLYSTSRTEFGFHHLQQLHFVGATQPAGTGRSMVSNRLLRHFITLFIPASTPETLKRIVGRLFDWITLQPNVSPTLKNLREGLINLTVDTFTAVSELLLPSPTKAHYLFNLRDLVRVWLGVSGMHPPSTRDDTALITLVVHECARVFSDRLINEQDVRNFDEIVDSKLQSCFKRSLRGIVGAGGPLLYTNFISAPSTSTHHGPPLASSSALGGASVSQMDASFAVEDRHYIRVPHLEAHQHLGEEVLRRYVMEMSQNSRGGGGGGATTSATGKIVVFDYLVQHVARIARIIQQPSGSVLLMGLGGTGRRSAAMLAAQVCGYTSKTIRASSKYTRDSWTEDVIHAMRQSGERGISLLFLLSDAEIKDEGFLEDVCSLLNAGDVPGLLSVETQDAIAHTLKNTAKDLGRDFGRDGCMELFVQRVRSNLHFALCFSPAGDTLRIRLRRFPSLVNCTTMNWMPAWPASALARVADSKLQQLSDILDDEKRGVAAKLLQQAFGDVVHAIDHGRETHELAINMYLTPTAFLDLLDTFSELLRKKTVDLKAQTQRYEGGLEVIRSTERSVAAMQQLLETNRPKLVVKSAQVAELIAQIDEAKMEASKERELVAVEEAQANRIAQDAKAVFDDCEANLAVALPAMNAATDAVSQIDKKQLIELRSLANPSDKIKKVIEAVCILLEVKPKEVRNPKTQKKELDYWTPTKTKVMAEVEVFRETLMNYDKDNMKPEIFEDKIQPFIKDKTFRPETVRDVSQALVGVTQWVLAMETYYRVRKVVKPKQERLAAAEAELKACQALLDEKKRSLQLIDDRLAVMRKQLDDSIAEKESLEQAQRDTEVKLERALRLNAGLADEKIRYGEELCRLAKEETTLFGDCLFASMVLGTLGPLPQEIRHSLRTAWARTMHEDHDLPRLSHDDRTFNAMLSTAVEELQWKVQGLPLDGFSVDSAIISQTCNKPPLLVDPQGQAVAWLRRMRASANLIVVKHDAADLHAKVKEAVANGRTLLLEDCPEEIDPFLYPVLDREFGYYNGGKVIALGDVTLPYNDAVRLVLTTKIARPHLLPSTTARVTVVQFSITPSGLTEQLLQRIIAHEDRDQDEKRNRVVEQQASSQEQLIELEDNILRMLSSGKDMLADDDMCEQLDISKKTSQTLIARLADAESFTKSFEKIRQRYILMAVKGSSLFFAVASLSTINNMYDFSLSWFSALLLKALERPHDEGESRLERCQRVLEVFYHSLFIQVSRAMFAKDKLAFSLMMLLRVTDAPEHEVHVLVRGPIDLPVAAEKMLPRPPFLTELAWQKLQQASAQLPPPLSAMAAIVSANDQDLFGGYCTDDMAHNEEHHAPRFDAAFAHALTNTQRLILVSLLAPRFFVGAVGQVVAATLGHEFVVPPPMDMDRTMKDMKDPTVPLIFVLAPGGDPLAAVRRFAETQCMASGLDTLSLGSGMDARAEQLIRKGAQQGRWVVLQNCHLFPSWMPTLDAMVEQLSHQRVETNNTFRLMLTTAPAEVFPQNLLQRSVKVVLEPPQGMVSNLSKLLNASPMVDPIFFEGSKNPSVFKRLCFSLCVFHSVVQERRSFGPLGWNIPYEFTDTDLRISLSMLQLFVDKAAEKLIQSGLNLAVPAAPPPITVTAGGGATATQSSTVSGSGGGGGTHTAAGPKASSVRLLDDDELTEGLSFDALQYLIGECNYGGRVTDVHDRRLLMELLREFVGPRLFDDDDPLFPVPAQGDIEAYRQFAADSEQQLTAPEALLGLDANALIARDERQAQDLMLLVSGSLPPLSVRAAPEGDSATTAKNGNVGTPASSTGGSALERIVVALADQLPPPFNIPDVQGKYPPNDYYNSLNAVLVQELERFNRLTRKIRGTLAELLRALRGEAALTSELDAISQELLLSTTPRVWMSVSYPSLKPVGSYIADLVRRLAYFQAWIDSGAPAICWLGGLYFPQSFVTGTLQNYCRQQRVTIDALTWHVTVLPREANPTTAPEAGCFLSGMLLEGCRWDPHAGTLAPSMPKVLIDEMPLVHMYPVPQEGMLAAGVTPHLRPHGPTRAPRTKDEFDFEDDDLLDDEDVLLQDSAIIALSNPSLNGASPTSATAAGTDAVTYCCPVYRTQERRGVLMTTGHSTNFLMYFDLPIPPYTKPSAWVKRGVAVFTTSSN